jgi:hypothetical protein
MKMLHQVRGASREAVCNRVYKLSCFGDAPKQARKSCPPGMRGSRLKLRQTRTGIYSRGKKRRCDSDGCRVAL